MQVPGGMMAGNSNGDVRPIREEKELVPIFTTMDEAEAMVVQGLLESNGIESILVNLEAPQDVLPGVGGVELRVRPSDEADARELIEQQRNDQALSEESNDSEIL
jgi:hypothetical protein